LNTAMLAPFPGYRLRVLAKPAKCRIVFPKF
jgi:hypothetical protein